MTGTIAYFILWIIEAAIVTAGIVLLVRFRIDHGIWKTKKEFSFDDLDKTLESQDYKAEVSKYLHKYKSDRRWYENRLAWEIGGLVLLSVLFITVMITIIMLRGRI